jgi:alpha-mannosidase
MIGNAHIDPVWLWRWQAGVDEALATFRSAADRCEEYPEFVFTRGESWLYEQVEQIDPDLFGRVKDLVERGQWHVTGGQYIQPDANLPTYAGWRRQIIHGQRYFEDRFGLKPTVGYNVDTFGHPGTLPDVLSNSGYEGYVFHRPGAHQVELPAQTFRWRGTGGGEILGFRIVPNYVTQADDLYGQIMLSVDAADPELSHTMCFYGVGNHGGGPTKGNIEYILENRHSFDGVELRFSTPQAFFEAVSGRREELPVVEGELQHCFPGCYSVMHDVKRTQVRGEHLLDRSERIIESLVEDEQERKALHEQLDAAWDDLLFTQFHDILAGTSIPSAWESVRAIQGRARITGEEITTRATRRWARTKLPRANHQQIVILNSDPEKWEGLIETEPFLDFGGWGDRWVSDLDGNPIDFQRVQPEASAHMDRILFPASIPAGEHLQVLLRDDPRPDSKTANTDLNVSPHKLSNRYLEVELGDSGIAGIRRGGQDLLGEGGVRLHLRRDGTDTWTFHTDRFEEPVEEVFSGGEWVVEEAGPLRARVRLEGWIGHSSFRWTLTLHREDPRLHMQLEIAFNEKYRLLQMPLHLAESPSEWTDGSGIGYVERTPGPAEWPVQGWSRVEACGKHLALVTSDAYSLSLDKSTWQWTLLRSPKMAWGGGEPEVYGGRDWHTDVGQHVFEFTLYVADQLEASDLNVATRQQAQEPIVFDRYEGLNRPPWGNSPPRALWQPGIQRALADGKMQHLLEEESRKGARPLFSKPEEDSLA